jgi:hypothetical protein
MRNGKTLPDETIDVWPEVFDEVTLNVLPVHYIKTVLINFKDGKSWEIDVEPGNKRKKLKEFQDGLNEILKSYKEHINEVDVKIDTDKVRKDVEKSIKRMLKKIKL